MTHLITADRALDVRARTAAAAADEALARFDELAPGERMVLIAGDGSPDVLRRFQAERSGMFEWSPLESGPAAWRVEIARRDAPRGLLRAVLEALEWDHDRLDELEQAAFRAREAGDLPAAFDVYEEFSTGLKRHIGFEEDLLFPVFEAASGMGRDAGPTAVMRAEHREIRDLLERIAAGIGDAAASVDALRAEFHAILADHNRKEECVLYPGTDQLLGPAGSDRLVREIQGYGIAGGSFRR